MRRGRDARARGALAPPPARAAGQRRCERQRLGRGARRAGAAAPSAQQEPATARRARSGRETPEGSLARLSAFDLGVISSAQASGGAGTPVGADDSGACSPVSPLARAPAGGPGMGDGLPDLYADVGATASAVHWRAPEGSPTPGYGGEAAGAGARPVSVDLLEFMFAGGDSSDEYEAPPAAAQTGAPASGGIGRGGRPL